MPDSTTLSGALPGVRPRITRRSALILAAAWTLCTLLYAVLLRQSVPALSSFSLALLSSAASRFFVALYAFPVWYLVVREMDAARWIWKIAAHLVLGPVFAVAWFVSYAGWVGTLAEAPLWELQPRADSLWMIYGALTEYVILFSVLHSVRTAQRLRAKERQARELYALAQQRELAALKAQINPHFLFNALNVISAMATRDAEEARDLIARLAELLRYALDSAEHDLVPLREELAFVQSYLALEACRFSDRLRVHYDVDPQAMDAPIPPLTLQALAENAIKHGIAPGEVGGEVYIRARAGAGHVDVTVEDTGVGGRASGNTPTNGIGLANTSARLQRLLGTAAVLHAGPREPHGFVVRFSVPAQPGAARSRKHGPPAAPGVYRASDLLHS